MATLARQKTESPTTLLDSRIPTPFPREQFLHFAGKQGEDGVVVNPFEDGVKGQDIENPFEHEAGPSTLGASGVETPNTVALKEVIPSIMHVQNTCLMALNNLLSEPIRWHPILPPRRHSMPSSPVDASSPEETTPTSALRTLVSNLRNHVSHGEMVEAPVDSAEADLFRELRMRVDTISPTLSQTDAVLAQALVNLLTNLSVLSDFQASISHIPPHLTESQSPSNTLVPPPIDVFDTLSRQISELQLEHLSPHPTSGVSFPERGLEASLLWSHIEAELEKVVAMCKQRVASLPKTGYDYLPPQYDMDDYDDLETLPDYEAGGRSSLDSPNSLKTGSFQSQAMRSGDEKVRMDLEAVAMAIERLYIAAPQLHNQRVELKSSKLAELEKLERARAEASRSARSSLTKVKENDVKELEKIVEMIGKASERRLRDQSVILDCNMLERAKRKETAKRDAFVDQLFHHSDVGRIHDQDAVLQVKDPEALLTLPEFIREPLPASERTKNGQAMLSLPEFVREPVPPHISSKMIKEDEQTRKWGSKHRKRSRSLSSPPLAWLRSSASRVVNGHTNHDPKGKAKASSQAFDVTYVAENHENLHHILVFFQITGGTPPPDVLAEVMPLFLNLPTDGGDHLLIKSGPHSSLPLMLPAHTKSGKQEVRVLRDHYELKLSTTRPPLASDATHTAMESVSTSLLDSTQLSTLKPTSFVCSSCSLPLIYSSKVNSYRDLPSEHWEELVEAWMCHGDQKLTDQVTKGKRGFWPSAGQALVGGSYILFEEGGMNAANLLVASEKKYDDWRLVRCLCGAIIGRCQDREVDIGHTKVYRVLKYAVRPVSPNSDPLKIPLSAFVVEDMMEFVQAHASYRFVISDEDEEKPRILIWLFKPKMRLAYTTSRHHVIMKSGNILAAKVLFKLLGPNERNTDIKSILNKYPGFPQAEYLSYPMSACRHIATALRDSNSAYPEGLRMMTGLEVGWLQRM